MIIRGSSSWNLGFRSVLQYKCPSCQSYNLRIEKVSSDPDGSHGAAINSGILSCLDCSVSSRGGDFFVICEVFTDFELLEVRAQEIMKQSGDFYDHDRQKTETGVLLDLHRSTGQD